MVYNNVFVTNEKTQEMISIMMTVFTRLLIDVRGGYDIWQHRREGALAGITSFAGNFPFTCVPLREFSIEIVTNVRYILAFSGILHGGYKSVHRTRASRCVKLPFFLITLGMERV
jgi:mannitol-specific phosphotransferase system IIBC component